MTAKLPRKLLRLTTGTITLAAVLALALPALAAAPKKNGWYAGKTSDHQPVDLYVSKTGKKFVYGSGATIVMKCSDGHPLRVSPNPLGVQIKNGSFSFTGKNKEFGPQPNTVTMTGKFTDKGKKVTGTVSYDGADSVRTCKSGTLTYTAKFKKVLR